MITFVDESENKYPRIDVQDKKMIAYDKHAKWFIHYKEVNGQL